MSDEITRYMGPITSSLTPEADGGWVTFEDHQHLLQAEVEKREEVEAAATEAHGAIKAVAKALLTVEGTLRKPYADDPRWSPWTRWFERRPDSPWPLLCRADTTLRKLLRDKGTEQGGGDG